MTLLYLEWHLFPRLLFRSIFARFPEQLLNGLIGILRKSWQVFHDRLLLVRCFRGFVLPVLEYSSAVWCSAADTHLKLQDRVISGASFLTGGALNVTLHIIDLWRYYVCCTISGVTRSTLFMVLYLCRMCRCMLDAVLWLHMCAFMSLLTAELRSTAGLLFSYQYLCGTIFVTPYSMGWDWWVSRPVPLPFYWPSCSLYFRLLLFSLSLPSFYVLVLWAVVFGLIGC